MCKEFSKSISEQWCYLNADNEFNLGDMVYVLDESVEEYRVSDKYNESDNYTNESYMEMILVQETSIYTCTEIHKRLRFFNQKLEEINNSLVTCKEGGNESNKVDR